MSRSGLLLVNLGTPDAPRPAEVRRYLREFLWDPRVIDIHPIPRALLLYGIILPLRPRQSAEAYEKIWTERGSPLLFHGLDLLDKVRRIVGPDVPVELAMRYKNPSVESALERFRQAGVDRVVVFPLFPQYSSSAWGSAVEKVFQVAMRLWNVPYLQVVPPYYEHPAFIDAFAAVARQALDTFRPDKILMSFHGLPERQVRKSDESGGRHCLASDSCCDTIVHANRNCYRAQCFATARGLGRALGLDDEAYLVTFQSRLGRSPWVRPYTDEIVRQLAKSGARRLAVLCPAFVADCLETLEEIGLRAQEDFVSHGGDELRLVPSLNSLDTWAEAVVRIVRDSVVI